jgi:hypothetical protein
VNRLADGAIGKLVAKAGDVAVGVAVGVPIGGTLAIWAVGLSGSIQKWDGATWTTQSSGTASYLHGVWGTDANNVWAVGWGGTIRKWNGTS